MSSVYPHAPSSAVHHAKLTDLQPNTRYWVVPVQNKVLGAETTFRSGKVRGGDVATRFAVYGDQYTTNGEGATATAAHLTERITKEDDIDYLLHVGDLSYGCGDTGRWNAWHDIIEPYSGRIPYLVSIGNHECAHTARCIVGSSAHPSATTT